MDCGSDRSQSDDDGGDESSFCFHENTQSGEGGRKVRGGCARRVPGDFENSCRKGCSSARSGFEQRGEKGRGISGGLRLGRKERSERPDRSDLNTPAAEDLSQHVTGPGQPGAQGGGLKIKASGDLVERSALEMEEHQRLAVAIRQTPEGSIQFAAEPGTRCGARGGIRGFFHGGLFPALTAFPRLADIQRQPPGHRVEPSGHRGLAAQLCRISGEGEERGLGHVLRIVMVGQDPHRNRVDHRAVALHQGGEGCMAPAAGEFLQQIGVRLVFRNRHFTFYHETAARNVPKMFRVGIQPIHALMGGDGSGDKPPRVTTLAILNRTFGIHACCHQ